MPFFSPSGGLSYHYLAFRYKNSLWSDYRRALARWLTDWAPKERNIILVGPSGGYNLPQEFLMQFEEVIVFDPDILAKYFFKRQHPHLKKVSWFGHDLLGLEDLNPDILNKSISSFKNHALLFCNILGQLPVILNQSPRKFSPEQIEKYMVDLGQVLLKLSKERSVASFHDVYSRETTGANKNVLRDHLTESYFHFSGQKVLLDWPLSPKSEHQIGLVLFS